MQLRKAEEFAPAKLKRRFDVDFGGGGEGSQGMGEAYKGYKLESEDEVAFRGMSVELEFCGEGGARKE